GLCSSLCFNVSIICASTICIWVSNHYHSQPLHFQRIAGSSVSPGLQYFGQSLSSSQDLSGDSLTDIAVGSRGSVLLLRSRPVLLVKTQVTYSPSKISTESTDCKATKRNEAKVCFQVSKVTKDNIGVLQATINYTLTLDATRLRYRAHFTPNTRQLLNTVRVGLGLMCLSHPFEIPNCPEDSLSSLSNELQFSMTGLPSSSADSLSPILDPGSGQRTFFPLDFERQCGADEKCVDNLKVDFNFSRYGQRGLTCVCTVSVP
uniref:Integrin alpha first immunoglubulin-like domain-containing protein n=1 Tax=Lepisosteus oculatus TaxID=7918 RepID=W5LXE6_LEPOC